MLAGLLANLPQQPPIIPDKGGIDLGPGQDGRKKRKRKRLIRQLIYAAVDSSVVLDTQEMRVHPGVISIAEEFDEFDFPMSTFLEGVGNVVISKKPDVGRLFNDDEDAILVLMLSY